MTRTPLQTTERIPRKVGGLKQIHLYAKETTFLTTGANPEDHQHLMADVHKYIGQHPLVVGGKGKRRIHVTSRSVPPTKIFDGVC
jgi:hypothetical protein